jgi:phospholipase/carboxylesterase
MRRVRYCGGMRRPLLHTAHVPAGNEPLPTLVLLHGWGANAHDLIGLAPLLQGGKAQILCPQGPLELSAGGGMSSYGWFPLVLEGPQDQSAVDHARDALVEFLDEAAHRYDVDATRLVIGGFSQGGMMAYDLALRMPERFSGLMALSTWLPDSPLPAQADADALSGLPVLIVHGRNDNRLSVERARDAREALRGLNVALTYREIDMGHEINREALQVITRWIEERAFSSRASGRADEATGS